MRHARERVFTSERPVGLLRSVTTMSSVPAMPAQKVVDAAAAASAVTAMPAAIDVVIEV